MGLFKIHLLSFFVISIIGTLTHFVYDVSNNVYLVGLFCPVNESVFEHLKMVLYPMLLTMTYEHIVFKKNSYYILAKLVSIILAILVIIVIFYTYTIVIDESVVIDVMTYYLAIFIGQMISYNILKSKDENKEQEKLKSIEKTNKIKLSNKYSKYILMAIVIIFIFFTFYPPRLGIFKDNHTNTYGILQVK